MGTEHINETVNSYLRGCYFAEAASVYVSFPFERSKASMHDHLDAVPIEGTTDTFFRPSSAGFNSLDDIEPLLTREHETEHYRTLVSTPFGLFLFRILQAATFCTQYVSVTINKHHGVPFRLDKPMLNWYRDKGHKLIDPNIKEHYNWSLRDWLEFLLVEGAAVRTCTNRLLQSSGSNAIEACENINLLLKAVKRIHGFKDVPVICPRSCISMGSGNLTVLSLIEARSRLIELAYLVNLGASELQISRWRKTRIQGVYAPVFNYVMQRLNKSVPLALLALDIAMLGPIDPVMTSEDTLFLEDIHPVLRLYSILDIVEKMDINLDNIQQVHDVTSKIYKDCNWPSPETLARRIESSKFMSEDVSETFSKEMNTETTSLLPSKLVEENIFTQCKRALTIRGENPLALAFNWSYSSTPNLHVFHPIIEYYRDNIRCFNPELKVGLIDHDSLIYLLYRHLMVSLLCSFIYDCNSHSLELARCLSNTYITWAQSEIDEKNIQVPEGMYFKLEEIAENDIGIILD